MNNRIICGDSRIVLQELAPETIDTIFTSPNPVFSFALKEYTSEVVVGSEKDTISYVDHLVDIFNECRTPLKDSGSLFVEMGDYYDQRLGTLRCTPELFALKMIGAGWIMCGKLIWHRTESHKTINREKGFRNNWEYLFHFVKDTSKFYFNNKSNRYWKTSVFSYPLDNSYYTNEFDSGFPEDLVKIAIETTVPVSNGVVCDIFAGSGTVGIVAKKMNKNYVLIDIDPKICELLKIRLK
jgi:site-specific DNA-methyltransferase (adenine-specific)